MKKIILLIVSLSLVALVGCTTDGASQQSVSVFGDVINTSGGSTATSDKVLELAAQKAQAELLSKMPKSAVEKKN